MYFWWQQARGPLVLFAFVATVLATTTVDVIFARWAFFDASRLQWRGADSWWINTLIHEDGRWMVRLIVAAALFAWTATFFNERYLAWRRPAGYFVLAVILTVGAVGLLKVTTNVDCAWDLAPFGGRFPYVHLFADRPDALPQARCFPAAHASSGYALMALYFLLRERRRRLARMGLAAGIVLGLIFGFAQQSRGAHLLSHDVWSAVLAWLIPLSLYVFAFGCRLWRRPGTLDIRAVEVTTTAFDKACPAGVKGNDLVNMRVDQPLTYADVALDRWPHTEPLPATASVRNPLCRKTHAATAVALAAVGESAQCRDTSSGNPARRSPRQ